MGWVQPALSLLPFSGDESFAIVIKRHFGTVAVLQSQAFWRSIAAGSHINRTGSYDVSDDDVFPIAHVHSTG